MIQENNKKLWAFPLKTIALNDYLLVWATGTEKNSDMDVYANFKSDSISGYLGLYDPRGEFVDSVYYGLQQKDRTEARIPNGFGDFILSYIPTPKVSNTTTLVPVELAFFEARLITQNQIELLWGNRNGEK